MCDCHEHKHTQGTRIPVLLRIFVSILLLICAIVFQITGLWDFVMFMAAYLIAGGDILLRAWKNIWRGAVFDENFLMSLATIGAIIIGEYPEAVMVMVLYQIGEYLQHKAVEKSRRSITELMDIRPDYANIEIDGTLEKKSPEEINIDDVIIVSAGEKVPLDGVIVEGEAVFDTSALTGESVPRRLSVGDNAVSGFINTNGVIKIKVTKKFGESTVAKILELVEHAGEKKAKAENFITKFARIYTPVVVVCALILALIPPVFHDGQFGVWFSRALTFLVISCPCALVISVPLGFFAGIGGASRKGILIKGSSYLEALSKPETVVFDKTGTLTKGTFAVTELVPAEHISSDELLITAAKAENYSNHPIALSLKRAYDEHIQQQENTFDDIPIAGLEEEGPSGITDVEEIAGCGVKANVDGETVLVGNDKLMLQFGVRIGKIHDSGTVVYVAKNSEYIGYIVISDEIKDDAVSTIRDLKEMKVKSVMLTGDSVAAAEYPTMMLGLDKYYSQLLPEDKVYRIEKLIEAKKKNRTILFAGDGINDAPVLMRADVGIAMGGLGSDAAIEAADVVIMDDKPSKIVTAINIARKTMRIVKQNIIFAVGIKILFLILGALGLMTMWGAVFADVGVALLAVLNSLRALR